MKRVFVGWPLWTPSPEGVRCVLGAEGTLGSEARDVKSKRHAPPSGWPWNRPRRPQKPRPEPGCHSWITASSALSVRVFSYLAAQLKDLLRLGGHHHGAHRCHPGTRHRHRVRDAHGARLAQPAHRRPGPGRGRERSASPTGSSAARWAFAGARLVATPAPPLTASTGLPLSAFVVVGPISTFLCRCWTHHDVQLGPHRAGGWGSDGDRAARRGRNAASGPQVSHSGRRAPSARPAASPGQAATPAATHAAPTAGSSATQGLPERSSDRARPP